MSSSSPFALPSSSASPRRLEYGAPEAELAEVVDEAPGWESTCTQILLGINLHTARIDELMERATRSDQAIATLQSEVRVAHSEKAEALADAAAAHAEAREAQAQVRAQAQQLTKCEARVDELVAMQQEHQRQLQLLQSQPPPLQPSHPDPAMLRALQEHVDRLGARLVALESQRMPPRLDERLGDVERALGDKASEAAALRRSLAELAPSAENARDGARAASVAEEASSVARRCELQLTSLREEANGWHRRLARVEAEAADARGGPSGRAAAAVEVAALGERLAVCEERSRAETQAAVQAAALHVKRLGSELLQELQAKAGAAETSQLAEKQLALDSKQRSLSDELVGLRELVARRQSEARRESDDARGGAAAAAATTAATAATTAVAELESRLTAQEAAAAEQLERLERRLEARAMELLSQELEARQKQMPVALAPPPKPQPHEEEEEQQQRRQQQQRQQQQEQQQETAAQSVAAQLGQLEEAVERRQQQWLHEQLSAWEKALWQRVEEQLRPHQTPPSSPPSQPPQPSQPPPPPLSSQPPPPPQQAEAAAARAATTQPSGPTAAPSSPAVPSAPTGAPIVSLNFPRLTAPPTPVAPAPAPLLAWAAEGETPATRGIGLAAEAEPQPIPESDAVGGTPNGAARVPMPGELDELREQVATLRELLADHLRAQPGLLQPLWSDFQVGRWTWRSGTLKTTFTGRPPQAATAVGLVPWNAERLNTCPELLEWRRDAAAIHVRTPGLYGLSCAVFSRTCPTLAVEVNGAVVLRRGGTSRHITDASAHIAGASIRDFLSLPADCHVAVRFESHGAGPADAQGFLELRKL